MAKTKRPPQTRKKLGGPRVGDDGPRQDKADAVAELQERFGQSTAVLLTEYRGMTVGELAELRASLREAGAEHKVFKNTLASIAARNAGVGDMVSLLEGPTSFTFATGDPVVAAKRLSDFAKRVPTLVIKGGLLEGKALSAAQVGSLATLESREVLLAKAAGMFLSPIQQLANLFAAPLNQLGAVLAQLRDKLPATAEGTDAGAEASAPAAEASAAEPDGAPEGATSEAEATNGAATEPEAPDTKDEAGTPDAAGDGSQTEGSASTTPETSGDEAASTDETTEG